MFTSTQQARRHVHGIRFVAQRFDGRARRDPAQQGHFGHHLAPRIDPLGPAPESPLKHVRGRIRRRRVLTRAPVGIVGKPQHL